MALISGKHEAVMSLIKALGLDPEETRKLVLIIEPDDVVRIKATKYVYDKDLEEMGYIIKHYQLELREENK